MKQQTKTKSVRKRKVVKRPVKAASVLIHAKRPVLRHFRLVKHEYTGKLMHHRHTSHLSLFVILAVLGFFLYASTTYVRATTQSGTVLIGVIVPGPAPTVGAIIKSPEDGNKFVDKLTLNISGTCAPASFVVVRDNEITAGSAACSEAGIFSVEIQLVNGENILSALNYDNLNQVGPKTPSVTISVGQADKIASVLEPVIPALPVNPSIVPGATSGISDCSDYRSATLPTGGEPHIAVVCVPRLFLPGIKQVLGIVVWGGQPPYAVSIDYDTATSEKSETDGETLLSISEPGYKTIEFSYAIPNTYKVEFMLKDKEGKTAIVNTTVQASGTTTGTTTNTTTTTTLDNILGSSWFQSPVPFYLVAVAITLGFWGGDLFDRRFNTKAVPCKRGRLKRVG